MMIRLAAIFITFFLIATTVHAQSPGGVSSGMQVWLKADAGVEEAPGDLAEDGDAITRWLDNSGLNLHYNSVAGPVLRTNTLNFNPAVEITSGGFDAPAGSELSTNWTTFFVSKKLASDNDGRVFDGNTGNYLWAHWGTFTNSIYINGNPSNFNSGIATTSGIQDLHLHTYEREATGGTLEARADGTSLATFGSSNSASGIRIDINQGASGEPSHSQIGEMIVFNAALTGNEVNRVESYLGIKYGLTVNHNYLASDGTTLWNAATNSAYHFDVAGIGRDDGSGLTQPKSISTNSDAAITLDKAGAFGNTNDFILWGNNNLTGLSTNIPAGYVDRTSRIWKVAVTGTPGSVIFSADLSVLGFPNTGNAADYALLIDTDTDFSAGATLHTAGASLVGNVLSFTGVNFSNNNFFALAVANLATPGGVGGSLALWLKADAGVEEAPGDPAENGDPVTRWLDNSGFGNNYIAVAGPTLQTNTLNFNPTVEILSGGFDAPVGSELSDDWTTFFVSKKLASDNNGRVFDGNTGNYLWAQWGTYTNSIYINGNPNNFNSGIATTNGIENLHLHSYKRESAGGTLEARADGTSLTTFGSSNSANGIRIDINQGAFSGESSHSQVSEMIMFRTSLSATEVNKIESYLAIKYGLTISHNYLASDGSVLWDVTTNAVYHNAVAGIGRDDITGLDQEKSRSANSTAALTIDKGGSFSTDKDFILWGNNNSTGTSVNVPSGYVIRSARIWKTAVNGTPGTVTVSVDLSLLGLLNTGSAGDYTLLIDTDTDFSTGATLHTSGASLVGDVLSFSSVALTNNNFITFAATNIPVPGGVTGATFWVKADAGVTGVANVSKWADQSGTGNHATQAVGGAQPSLVSGSLNFNPTIDFSDQTDILQFTTPLTNLNTTIFTAAIPAPNAAWRTMFRGNATDHPLLVQDGGTSLGYYDNDNGQFKGSGFSWLENEPAVVGLEMRTGDVNFRKNGSQGASISTINLSGVNIDYFGNYQGNGQRFGKIAETIVFQTASPLSTTDKSKIESYLAVKYGITLTHDYITSAGTTIWDASANSTYHNDVAGIGRDDLSKLDQQKSLSVNSDGAVTLDKGSAFGMDQDFILWGNDNATSVSTNVPPTYVERAKRIWKVSVTGTPGMVSFSVDLTKVGLPNTGSASDYALLIDTDTDFSTGSNVHLSGASLVGSILSFTGVTFSNNDFFSVAAMNVAIPGGIAGAVFWVKADVGVVGTTNISKWTDQSGTNNDANQATMANQPSLVDNDLNFNPSVNFFGSTQVTALTTPPANLNTTVFTVGKPTINSTWRTMFRGSAGDHPLIVEAAGTALGYYDSDVNTFKSSGFTWLQNEPAVVSLEMRNSNVNFRKNGAQGASITTINLAGLNLDYFGNYQFGNQQFGKIEEAIIYNTPSALTAAEKEQIESYLGLKYGITLVHSYRTSTSAIVWDASANATYHHSVAGIGKDTNAGLNQKQSKSQSSGAVLTIGLGTIDTDNATNPNTFSADKSYFIWGNNTAALNSGGVTDIGTTVNAETIVVRLNRVWLAEETGTVGTLKVRFDLSSVPGHSGTPGENDLANVRLLVDGDGVFAAGATSIAPTTFDNTTDIVEFDYDFTGATGFYFTIASVDYASTPLPIELVSFTVEGIEQNNALATWKTASELNNDHFTLERSTNGQVWEDIGSVAGSGTSNITHTYQFVDHSPFPGTSYYRLRQTDFDGTFTLSQIVPLFLDGASGAIRLYPNPAHGTFFIEGADIDEAEITMINLLGQKISPKMEREPSKATVETTGLPSGPYMIIITRPGQHVIWKKVLVQ